MPDEYEIFYKFHDESLAEDFIKLLIGKNIPFEIDDIIINTEPIFSEVAINRNLNICLYKIDFKVAEQLLERLISKQIALIDDDYYLYSFSNFELVEVIVKADEWSFIDSHLAKRILNKRGCEISSDELHIQKRKLQDAELAKPERANPGLVFFGYVIALVGLLGWIIGLLLIFSKNSLSNGLKVYKYNENDRKHGKRIIILGLLSLFLWIFLIDRFR